MHHPPGITQRLQQRGVGHTLRGMGQQGQVFDDPGGATEHTVQARQRTAHHDLLVPPWLHVGANLDAGSVHAPPQPLAGDPAAVLCGALAQLDDAVAQARTGQRQRRGHA
jgi:hypothetical protein